MNKPSSGEHEQKLRELIAKWPHDQRRKDEEHGDMRWVCRKTCQRCQIEALLAEPQPAPPSLSVDAEENLADYLLRNHPPTWDYEIVLVLARAVAGGCPCIYCQDKGQGCNCLSYPIEKRCDCQSCLKHLLGVAKPERTIGGTIGLDGDTQRDWASDGPALEKRVKELEGAGKPSISAEQVYEPLIEAVLSWQRELTEPEQRNLRRVYDKLYKPVEAEIRDRVLEEAALFCERFPGSMTALNLARGVRALKSQVSVTGPQ